MELKIGGYYTSPMFTPGTIIQICSVDGDTVHFVYRQALQYAMLVGYYTYTSKSYAQLEEVSELTKALL